MTPAGSRIGDSWTRVTAGRGDVSHTVPVSDSGFVDEAPTGRGVPTSGPDAAPTARSRRRPGPAGIGFIVLVVALLAFGFWAWSSRVHTDDVAAYESLAREVEELDRSMVPLGHSELPPCRESIDGRITRTYPPSTGPQAAELVGYLEQKGWTQGSAVPPVVGHLTRVENGHVLTVDVAAGALNQLVASLTASSPGSSLGCLGR